MESVWQLGGSIRVKISKLLPFDIHPTSGGMAWQGLVTLQNIFILAWPILQPEYVMWKTLVMIVPGLLAALLILAMRHDSPWLWAHFIGTDVKCRDAAHQKAIEDWAWANHTRWSEFTTKVATPDKGQYSVRFRSREKAMLAKLSV